ncbi:uncharacterized protein LOC109711506 [Ananas comosus]|uniref:Uncharacterized protein LOC109711506 n=1 Tax=Ananas comosus TaxID=4615 RepID=A0A199UT81_ANACO|nr:uncharacterized protein LOC109711506 [Ananas comosus]OAY67845.1 hypothetical protein ACMD2_10626 [Ananas comosus]
MAEDGAGAAAAAVAEEKQASYRYWVREAKQDAAPLPVPRKLDPADIPNPRPATALGSVWNQAGTWEERNLNSWATNRIKELLSSLGSLEFASGKACIDEVSKCSGDAFLVTVRNKKRVGYTYELTLKFKGEWLIQSEKKKVKGHLDIPEFSFGELEDLEVEVRFSDENGLGTDDKTRIFKDLRAFLPPIREKLHKFEEELKDR